MNNYESLIDALTDLKIRGYKKTFRREQIFLCCIELDLWIAPYQFNVDEFYQFDANISPEAERVVYAIATDTGIKGILVDECGVYSEYMSAEMTLKLQSPFFSR